MMGVNELTARALDNAWKGGWRDFIKSHTAEEIAVDLADCDSQLADYPLLEIKTAVLKWKAANPDC